MNIPSQPKEVTIELHDFLITRVNYDLSVLEKRSFLATLSVNAGLPVIYLPVINFYNFKEEVEIEFGQD